MTNTSTPSFKNLPDTLSILAALLILHAFRRLEIVLCYFMLYILYLKSNHKNSLQKTNKHRLIDTTLTPGDQVWFLAAVAIAAATTYSDEV